MARFTPVLFNDDALALAIDDPSFAQNLRDTCVAERNGTLGVRGFRKTWFDRLLAKFGLYRRFPKEKNRYGVTDCAQILRPKMGDENRLILCWDYGWYDISDYAWQSDDDLAAAGDRMPNKNVFKSFIDTIETDLEQLKSIYDKVYGGD